jgi:four helix bundle protein
MELFRMYVEVADWVWSAVSDWPSLAQDTVGKQLIRAADSVGANLVEGDGRYGDADALHFFVVARASARETRYWLQRAAVRGLITSEVAGARIQEITSATRLLNILIRYRRNRSTANRVREEAAFYDFDEDPFAEDLFAEE